MSQNLSSLMKSSLFNAVFSDYCSLRITLEVRGSTAMLHNYRPTTSVCTGMNQQDTVSTVLPGGTKSMEWNLKGTKRR